MKHITFNKIQNPNSGRFGLVPQNQDDVEFLKGTFGNTITFLMPDEEQDPQLHKKYFAILNSVIDSVVDVSLINNHTGLKLKNGDDANCDVLRRFIMVEKNFLTPAKISMFGQEVMIQFPKSVSYESMKAEEFNRVYKATIDWLYDFLRQIDWNETECHKLLEF